jgi:hypothetical protein
MGNEAQLANADLGLDAFFSNEGFGVIMETD